LIPEFKFSEIDELKQIGKMRYFLQIFTLDVQTRHIKTEKFRRKNLQRKKLSGRLFRAEKLSVKTIWTSYLEKKNMKRTEKYHYFVIFFFCDEKTFCFVIALKRFIIIKNIKSFGPGNGFQLKFPMFFLFIMEESLRKCSWIT